MNAKVLVTGGLGFVGANLIRAVLRQGFAVFAAVRSGSNLSRLAPVQDQINLVNIDLLDKDVLEGTIAKIKPEYIFHLAAFGAYPHQTDEEKIVRTNVDGTSNLLNACEKVGFKKFIFTGTSSEYGPKKSSMKESDLAEPNTAYGKSKLAATQFCLGEARAKNLPVVIFRPFSIYGPWEEKTRLIPTLIRRSLANEDLDLVSPEIVRDFMYVGDVCEAYLKTFNNDKINGEILNICSGKQSTIKEVVDLVLQHTKSHSKQNWNVPSVGRSYDATTWVGDPKKTKEFLGWVAQTSLEQGIIKTIEWFKKHGKFYN